LIKVFEKLIKLVFKYRKVLNIFILSYIYKLLKLYLANSLYLVENIETALKTVFGTNKNILDYLYTISTNTRVGLFIIMIRDPLCYIFTNYNDIGTQEHGQNESSRYYFCLSN
jgi:hypothetical protein